MSLKATFAKPLPYVVWLLFSAVFLVAAWAIDPYLFGFTAFGSAAISGVMAILGFCFGTRALLWSVFAAIPTALSFALLATYNWA